MYVLLNDFFTAANGVLIKKKLESKDLGKYGVMYYNSLFMLLPAALFAWQTGDIQEVAGSRYRIIIEKYFSLIPLQSLRAGMTACSPFSSYSLVCLGLF